MIVRTRVQSTPWLAERIQIALAVALSLAVVLILATGWGLT